MRQRSFKRQQSGPAPLLPACLAVAEIRDVLNRPKIRAAFPQLTNESIQDFLDHLLDKGQMVVDIPHVYSLPRDPNDEPYLDLAIATRAAFIVTRDNDLLDLMQDEAFRKLYPDIAILNPVAFLHHVRTELAKEQNEPQEGHSG